MIRIAREFGCLPHEVAERLPEDWFQTLQGFYSFERYMQERPEPVAGGNV